MTDEKGGTQDNPFDEFSLYEAMESENFELFKELQVLNETKICNRFFFDKITELFVKKFEQDEDKKNFDDILARSKTVLTDLIVSTKDFTVGNNISFGSSAIVYEGTYKFIKVAIKKMSMCTVPIKQLVS
jgi:hypothetical protein